jgi:hypothetical protein
MSRAEAGGPSFRAKEKRGLLGWAEPSFMQPGDIMSSPTSVTGAVLKTLDRGEASVYREAIAGFGQSQKNGQTQSSAANDRSFRRFPPFPTYRGVLADRHSGQRQLRIAQADLGGNSEPGDHLVGDYIRKDAAFAERCVGLFLPHRLDRGDDVRDIENVDLRKALPDNLPIDIAVGDG